MVLLAKSPTDLVFGPDDFDAGDRNKLVPNGDPPTGVRVASEHELCYPNTARLAWRQL
jgi:hypothetical protein